MQKREGLETEYKPGNTQLVLLESDCAKAIHDTKKPIPHEKVFKRVL